MRPSEPDRLLDDLDPEQREAVTITTGPLAILAAAGTGKTRVISRRTAYAIGTGVVPADQVLVVTFTDKAAREMVARLGALGLPGVTARTFHAHARHQLRHFWPASHDGAPLPELLESKAPLLVPLVRRLPGHYRFTPAKDLADEIEWAKSRRITPATYDRDATEQAGREPPIPVDLFVRVFADYERRKRAAGRIDFDDLLLETVTLLEDDPAAADLVRARKRWFSVDEYQDTNPLGQRLLELWLGERDDLCVVGDEDQTIYTFTGATSTFLTSFAERHPGARTVALVRNYRSTPEVLELANRLLAGEGRTKRLVATREGGPEPAVSRFATADAELDGLVDWIRRRVAAGTDPAEVAVLVRVNAQLAPIEEALTRAGIVYQVRGVRFYDRPEVRAAIEGLRRLRTDARGTRLATEVRAAWTAIVGRGTADGDAEDPPSDVAGPRRARFDEAAEQEAAIETLTGIVEAFVAEDPAADVAMIRTELERRAADERETGDRGVNLLTIHRAKGLEWDAVIVPGVEEGGLPIRQALDDPAALAEERRLLYVAITRARTHLALTWAERREVRGRDSTRRPSAFLLDLRPPRPPRPATADGTRTGRGRDDARSAFQPVGPGRRAADGSAAADPLFTALRAWRSERARTDAVPAYVVAHDTTLQAIADARPRSLAALRRVRGMGPAKLERYGDEIVELVTREP